MGSDGLALLFNSVFEVVGELSKELGMLTRLLPVLSAADLSRTHWGFAEYLFKQVCSRITMHKP